MNIRLSVKKSVSDSYHISYSKCAYMALSMPVSLTDLMIHCAALYPNKKVKVK